MEKGLFSRLQSYFDSSYGGRYVELLIKEAIEEQPKLAKQLFGVNVKDRLETESRFPAKGRTRIADLAFLNSEDGRPTCLIEIKYEDHKAPGNAAQIEDYLDFCGKNDCEFVYVSQHLPKQDVLDKLEERGRLVLFSELADNLAKSEDSVAGLLRRFFVDRGLVMHEFEDRDRANLRSFVFRLLNPWGGQGRTQNKDAMGGGGAAEAFGHVLRNMNIIAMEVATNEKSGRTPTIDFHLDPYVYPKEVENEAKEAGNGKAVSAAHAKAGGVLYVFGRIRLDDTSKNWLQVEFGLCVEVNQGNREFRLFSYAEVLGYCVPTDGGFVRKPAKSNILDDKKVAVLALRSRIKEVVARAATLELPPSQKSLLRRFATVTQRSR